MTRQVEGTLNGHCTFRKSIEKETGHKVIAGYHVADLGNGVAVCGPVNSENVDLECAKLIASSLGNEDLSELIDECKRLLLEPEGTIEFVP